MTPTQTRPATLPQLLAILFALVPVIAVVTLVLVPGGGHPSLDGVLLMGAVVPTLAAYLSRALEGSDFPSALFLVLGALEYPLVGYGVGSLAARVRSSSSSRLGILLLVAYIAAHFGAHIVLNQQAVNLRRGALYSHIGNMESLLHEISLSLVAEMQLLADDTEPAYRPANFVSGYESMLVLAS